MSDITSSENKMLDWSSCCYVFSCDLTIMNTYSQQIYIIQIAKKHD